MYWKEQLKPLFSTLVVFTILVVLLSQFIICNPAFDKQQKEVVLNAGDSWLQERQERNLASMNQHYYQFMTLGQAYLQDMYIDVALNHFFHAKTLFPERIEPRKNLCYSYIVKCQEDYRWCKQAKREIYYALRYVNDQDKTNKEYIESLAHLVKLDTIMQMDEADALSAIYVSD